MDLWDAHTEGCSHNPQEAGPAALRYSPAHLNQHCQAEAVRRRLHRLPPLNLDTETNAEARRNDPDSRKNARTDTHSAHRRREYSLTGRQALPLQGQRTALGARNSLSSAVAFEATGSHSCPVNRPWANSSREHGSQDRQVMHSTGQVTCQLCTWYEFSLSSNTRQGKAESCIVSGAPAAADDEIAGRYLAARFIAFSVC